jgi:hypothetical protein
MLFQPLTVLVVVVLGRFWSFLDIFACAKLRELFHFFNWGVEE